MIITIHAGILSRSTSAISAEHTKSLSASGSINFPKFVTRLYFLAILPSKRSVRLARINIAAAIISPVIPSPGIYRNIRNTGIIIVLNIVSLLGKFNVVPSCLYSSTILPIRSYSVEPVISTFTKSPDISSLSHSTNTSPSTFGASLYERPT